MKKFRINTQGAKSKLKFLNVPSRMRSEIVNGSLLFGAAFGSYGLFKLIGSGLQEQEVEPDPDDYVICDGEAIEVEVDFEIPEVVEEVGFAEAFAEARAELGPGAFFEFEGRSYNTYYAEEWDALQSEEQSTFETSIADAIDVESLETTTIVTVDEMEFVDSEQEIEVFIDEGPQNTEHSSKEPSEFVDNEINLDTSEFDLEVAESSSIEHHPSEDNVQFVEVNIQSDPGGSSDFNDPLFKEENEVTQTNDVDLVENESSDFHDPLFDNSNAVNSESSSGSLFAESARENDEEFKMKSTDVDTPSGTDKSLFAQNIESDTEASLTYEEPAELESENKFSVEDEIDDMADLDEMDTSSDLDEFD